MKPGEPFNPYKMFTGVFIPEALVRCPDLSPGAKLAYGRLARYMGKGEHCYPSLATLGRELGSSRDSAKRYVQELAAGGLIRVKARKTKAGDSDTSEVVFLWHTVFETEGVGVKMPLPGRGKNAPGVGANLHRGVGVKMPPKESQKEESHHHQSHFLKESQPRGPETRGSTPAPSDPKATAFQRGVDDDEKTPPEKKTDSGPRYASPRDELIALVREKYGELPTAKTMALVTIGLEGTYPPITWEQYLDGARPHLERGRLRNVEGFLVSFARGFRLRTTGVEPQLAPPPAPEKCPLCREVKGRGLKLEGARIVFCECATAEFRAQMLARGIVQEENAA
jgi:hypothetical protein